jgi:hypothetical protein
MEESNNVMLSGAKHLIINAFEILHFAQNDNF